MAGYQSKSGSMRSTYAAGSWAAGRAIGQADAKQGAPQRRAAVNATQRLADNSPAQRHPAALAAAAAQVPPAVVVDPALLLLPPPRARRWPTWSGWRSAPRRLPPPAAAAAWARRPAALRVLQKPLVGVQRRWGRSSPRCWPHWQPPCWAALPRPAFRLPPLELTFANTSDEMWWLGSPAAMHASANATHARARKATSNLPQRASHFLIALHLNRSSSCLRRGAVLQQAPIAISLCRSA